MNGDSHFREDVYSISVRAGKRTYFFDIKTTRGQDLYMTITESKRTIGEGGDFNYEKHKLFLYKEDFDNFVGGLQEAVDKIKELKGTGQFPDDGPMDRKKRREQEEHPEGHQEEHQEAPQEGTNPTDVSFDDL